MDKYIFDENNGLWYELIGDYYFPSKRFWFATSAKSLICCCNSQLLSSGTGIART